MSYPNEMKISLVREYEQGKTVAEVSNASGIPVNSIYRWIREYKTVMTANSSFTPKGLQQIAVALSKSLPQAGNRAVVRLYISL